MTQRSLETGAPVEVLNIEILGITMERRSEDWRNCDKRKPSSAFKNRYDRVDYHYIIMHKNSSMYKTLMMHKLRNIFVIKN